MDPIELMAIKPWQINKALGTDRIKQVRGSRTVYNARLLLHSGGAALRMQMHGQCTFDIFFAGKFDLGEVRIERVNTKMIQSWRFIRLHGAQTWPAEEDEERVPSLPKE